MKRKTCPCCNKRCKLTPISSFDLTGEKLGAMWVCSCGWNDWGHIIEVKE